MKLLDLCQHRILSSSVNCAFVFVQCRILPLVGIILVVVTALRIVIIFLLS
jgi:hypothetical protein